MSECCDDYECRRKKPILVRKSELTDRWYVVTDYKEIGSGVINATTRHDITDDFTEYLRQNGWTHA